MLGSTLLKRSAGDFRSFSYTLDKHAYDWLYWRESIIRYLPVLARVLNAEMYLENTENFAESAEDRGHFLTSSMNFHLSSESW